MKCAWCEEQLKQNSVNMQTFDAKPIKMHGDCFEIFKIYKMRDTWNAPKKLHDMMEAEANQLGALKGMDALKQGLIKCNSPLFECQLLRAQYERKKMSVQDTRYEEQREEAQRADSKRMTDEQIEEHAIQILSECLNENKDKIDAIKLKYALNEHYNIVIGRHKAYNIRKLLMMHGYPEDL